jgi:histone H3/H4
MASKSGAVGGEMATSYLSSMRLMAANLKRLPVERIVKEYVAIARVVACALLVT